MALTGRWRIVEMDLFDASDLDLLGPAFIELRRDRTGGFQFLAVAGSIDCRAAKRDGRVGVEFSWDGTDECDQVCGRGWAFLNDDGSLAGHIFIHMGDDSGFVGQPDEPGQNGRR